MIQMEVIDFSVPELSDACCDTASKLRTLFLSRPLGIELAALHFPQRACLRDTSSDICTYHFLQVAEGACFSLVVRNV